MKLLPDMIVARSPSKVGPVKPASRAVALATAAAVALASFPVRAADGSQCRHPDDSRRRDRAALARLHGADFQGRRSHHAKRSGRHHQRPRVQRVRHGCAPHLREYRRADAIDDAQSAHRRVRPRMRPHRRRSSFQDAPGAGERADRDDRRHAARRRRPGGGRTFRQRRHGQCRRRAHQRSAGSRDEHAARLSARPGRIGRSRRRSLPDHDPSVGEGHVRHVQALRRPVLVRGVRLQSLFAEPSGARRTHGGARRRWRNRRLTGTRKTRPSCNSATT